MYRHIHPTDSAAVKHEKKVSNSIVVYTVMLLKLRTFTVCAISVL